ncbi:MAG: hypothetical protein LWY06_03700 [Firmicutes bacterium]|nr:hypothetical protein [Bacillota bacterium]
MSTEKNGKNKENSAEKEPKGNSEVSYQKVGESIEKSYKTVKEDLLNQEKALRLSITVKTVLLVFVIIYLGIVFHYVSQINAEEIVSMTKNQFEAKLPEISKQLANDLKSQAPATMDSIKKRSLEIIPQVREHMQAQVHDETKKLTDGIGEEVNTLLAEYVKDNAAKINQSKSDKTDLDKAKLLIQMIRSDFKKTVQEAADKHLEEYSKDMMKLNADLKKLKDSKKLTPKEKYHKDLIAVWAKLMKMEMKDVHEGVSNPAPEETPQPEVPVSEAPQPDETNADKADKTE